MCHTIEMQALFKRKHVHFYIFPTILPHCMLLMGLPWWISDKFHYLVGKIPWRRKWQPTPVFLLGKSHGQRGTWWATVHGVTKYQTWFSTNNNSLLFMWVWICISICVCVCAVVCLFIFHIKTSIKSGNIWLLNYFMSRKEESEVAQLYPTFCDPMDCSLPGFSVHGIFQARVLVWVTISFSRGIFWTQDSNLGLLHCRQALLPSEPPGKSPLDHYMILKTFHLQCLWRILLSISMKRFLFLFFPFKWLSITLYNPFKGPKLLHLLLCLALICFLLIYNISICCYMLIGI